jgi:hypothetical protein
MDKEAKNKTNMRTILERATGVVPAAWETEKVYKNMYKFVLKYSSVVPWMHKALGPSTPGRKKKKLSS